MLTVSEIIKTVDTDDKIFERVELCLNDFKNNFVRLGYMLRVLKERGYDNAFLQERFGLSKSTINRSIQINEHFSENGYSYKLDEKYSDFKKSQLIEMLPLSQEQRDEVSADMSVAEIRELKNSEDDEDEENDCDDDPVCYNPVPDTTLPRFSPNSNFTETCKWIFDALSAIPEVGSDVNIQENFLKSKKCKDILINKEMDLYISSGTDYYVFFTSSKYEIPSWCYVYISNYVRDKYVLDNSSEAYIVPLDPWRLSSQLSSYLISQIIDFSTLDHDKLFDWLVENCTCKFDLGDEISVCVSSKSFECSKKTKHCSVSFKSVKEKFESAREDLLNEFAAYVIEQSIDKYEFLFHMGDYDVYMGIGFRDFKYLILRDTENSELGFKYLIYDEDGCEPFFVNDVLLFDFFESYDMCVFRVWISNLDKNYCHRETLFKNFLESRECIKN